eukprot:15439282-Alexandrium_andersonii.AAC.1
MSGPQRQAPWTTGQTAGGQAPRPAEAASALGHVPAARLGTAQGNAQRQGQQTPDGQRQQQPPPSGRTPGR